MPSARPATPGQQANLLSPTDSYSQHVVTAVIVAHDGAAWLPRLMEALNEQTKPVQRVVAVDTGSRDRSGSVLAALVGQSAVFGMDRTTGYAAAVRRAVQHKAATAPVPGGQSGRGHADQVEWLWLLHDDCEPAADALEQLLRGAAETPNRRGARAEADGLGRPGRDRRGRADHRHGRPPDHRHRAARGRPGPARRRPGRAGRVQRRHARPARRVGADGGLRSWHDPVRRGRGLLLAGARGRLSGSRHHRRRRLPRPGRRARPPGYLRRAPRAPARAPQRPGDAAR